MSTQEKYAELLAAARANGQPAQAVVELHAPEVSIEPPGWPTHLWCRGCFGAVQGSDAYWPEDCETTKIVARCLGVEL